MKKLFVTSLLLAFLITSALWASPQGADAVPHLYAPSLAGPGAFTTTTGDASASAINPAQGGTAHRMVFDAGFLGIVSSEESEFMQAINFGALFPTRFGVFGGSMRYIGGWTSGVRFEDEFPIGNNFHSNLFAAKEIYPGMSLGVGLNLGGGHGGLILSGDLGFHYNRGQLGYNSRGLFDNFTWAVVLRGLGVSSFPTPLTLAGGVSFDLIRVKGTNGQPDPFALNFSADMILPSIFAFMRPELNFIFKTGIEATIRELITVSASFPSGSGFNARDAAEGRAIPLMPSIGVAFNFRLPTGGEGLAGGRLPSDGDLRIAGAFRPVTENVSAFGGGVSWFVGQRDTTPPRIEIDYPETFWFAPNNTGIADYLEFPIRITDDNFVTSWMVEITDEEGNVVRTIENREQRFTSFDIREVWSRIWAEKRHVEIPPTIRWDGSMDSGGLAPDGRYFFTITATDNSGNTATTGRFETVIKTSLPEISINPMTEAQRIFDPTGQGGHINVTFTHTGSDEERWESGIWNAAGVQIRRFAPMSGRPGPVVWDGRNDAGEIAPDGVYSFTISATDRAQNFASATMPNIILDTREADAFLTSSVSAIAPAVNQTAALVSFGIRLLLNEGIDDWRLELLDDRGISHRTFTGTTTVPSSIGWNGLNEQGEIREGIFTPRLTVNYTRGDKITTTATNVIVRVSGPALAFTSFPEFFSPDNDGVDDELFIRLFAISTVPIATWRLEIREPEPPYNLFRTFEGRGSPAGQLIWDGRSDWGELVQSAMDYPYRFTAVDILGNSSTIEGTIGVDVLVIRDGDRLRIMIPAIIFRPDHADFVGLSQEVVDNNMRVLQRIAQILNRFRDYRVVVEGHANAIDPPGTAARDNREAHLHRISEARARAVVDHLVRFGVARNRLTAIGAGTSNPVAEYEDRDNWWKNRRVEFLLIR